MRIVLQTRWFHIVIAAVLIVTAVALLLRVNSNRGGEIITAEVTRGEIVQIVAVSGVVNAENTAALAFPVSDVVADIRVKEGDGVAPGQILATLNISGLVADRQDAIAALEIAKANRDELLAGPTSEQRSVTDQSVSIATEELERVMAAEKDKVQNARRTLLSSNLEALPTRADNSDVPPTISGTYICENEGEYKLAMFSSSARSGYSYRLSGLESGTYTAYTEAPSRMGNCGLSIQFDEATFYGISEWTITIPNKRSAAYTSNLNAYNLALTNQTNAVRAAEQALDLALREQTATNASPRDEALRRANASVLQAEARLATIDSRIADKQLRAPFAGTVTDVTLVPGETAGTQPVVTMVANNEFELLARIPEIDIAKLQLGQRADVVFDARDTELVQTEISFISPIATEIDGVAYFKATLSFTDVPHWLRGGLNADIDIITARADDVLRLPKRFVVENETGPYVLLKVGATERRETPVEIGFSGNDGYIEVIGLNEGDVVVAP